MGAKNIRPDAMLTKVSQEYKPEGFIGDILLPELRVKNYTGKLGKKSNSHLRIQTSLIGGKGSTPVIDVRRYTTDAYEIEEHGLREMLTERDFDNVIKPFDAKKDSIEALKLGIQIGKEKALADTLSDTGYITQNVTLAGTSQFNDVASTPLDDFKLARKTIRNSVGRNPNVAIMSEDVKDELIFHADIIKLIRGDVQPGANLTDQELAKALKVKKVIIGSAMYNNTNDGQNDEALTNIWGKHVIFAVIADKAAVGQISLGYNVKLAGKADYRAYTWSAGDPENAVWNRVNDSYDQLLSNPKAAYLIKDAVA